MRSWHRCVQRISEAVHQCTTHVERERVSQQHYFVEKAPSSEVRYPLSKGNGQHSYVYLNAIILSLTASLHIGSCRVFDALLAFLVAVRLFDAVPLFEQGLHLLVAQLGRWIATDTLHQGSGRLDLACLDFLVDIDKEKIHAFGVLGQ